MDVTIQMRVIFVMPVVSISVLTIDSPVSNKDQYCALNEPRNRLEATYIEAAFNDETILSHESGLYYAR